MSNLCYNKQALQSNFIDGYIAKKKQPGPEGPRRATHHTQHAVTNRRALHFIGLLKANMTWKQYKKLVDNRQQPITKFFKPKTA